MRFGGVRAKDAKVSGIGLFFAGATFITAKGTRRRTDWIGDRDQRMGLP